ncbi:MAG: hypothetical protein KatS3mg105_4551 [Gemmatales bacterium]|nr:MAG: hypothetical protein KatS3mg105_4551 [Gemmatales bacterium]
MLVLSRKYGEEVVLPDQGIVFTILEVRGDKVRVGITAPTNIPVYRREVWTRILQNRAANGEEVEDVVSRAAKEPVRNT